MLSKESVKAVEEWIHAAGISADRTKLSNGLNWITFDATVDEAESLLKTEFHVYEHETGQQHVACEEYSVPRLVQRHVDFVTPSLHFDVKLKARDEEVQLDKRTTPGAGTKIGKPGGWSLPKLGQWISRNQIIQQLIHCDTQIVPNCLRALYEFGPGVSANPKNSYGIVEYTPQAYVPSDLDLFFKNFSRSQVGERPILDSIDGGVVQQTNMSFDYNGMRYK